MYDDAPAQGTSAVELVTKLLFVLLFSTVIAFVMGWMSKIWLKDSGYSNSAQSNIWFAVFICSFSLSASLMAIKYIPKSAFASAPAQRNMSGGRSSSGNKSSLSVDDYEEEDMDLDAEIAASTEEGGVE